MGDFSKVDFSTFIEYMHQTTLKNHTILHSLTHALKCSFYKDVFAQLRHLPLEYRIRSTVFRRLSVEFQISAKRQLLGHYLAGISCL